MKKLLLTLFVLAGFIINAQTSCQTALPFCTGGVGGVTFPATVNGPPAQIGPDYDCLGSEPNPAWYYLQVSQTGNLIISIQGQLINLQPGGDVDFCCWGPFNTLAGCCNSLTAPNVVDCSYSPSWTETLTIPFGVAGQYYMVLITNFANVAQNIVFTQVAGTGSTNCGLLVNSSNICAGKSATIVANNQSNLTNPSFSINPGGLTSPNPTFVVTPTVTTTYTVYVTGMNNVPALVTQTAVTTVTVNPSPTLAPTFTQATCTNSNNAVNLNLTFIPPNPVPGYTVAWSPTPPSVLSPTQTSATNLAPGTTSVIVTANGGCTTAVVFTMGIVPPACSFTISPPGGTYSITCLTQTINLTAAPAANTYTWISITNPSVTGSSVSFTATGNYTVTSTEPVGGCTSTQTIAIGMNTLAPTNSVNPVSQAITCATNAAVTFSGTVSNPTINIQHDWYSPLNPLPGGVPIATSNNTISILSGALPPGVYTLVTTNLPNGCTTQKTVTITSLSAWPSFNIGSSTNFSVGCSPLNQTTLSILNPVSTQTPPSTCSFTFLPPGFGGTLAAGPYSGNTSTITTIPGTWTVIVSDNSNGCTTKLSVPIIQNTVAPHVVVTMTAPIGNQTLTCFQPTLLATGSSTTTNAQINWLQPIAPPLVSTATILVGPGSGPNTSTTSTTYANYTVVSTNTVNACVTTSVVVISQNFKKPVSSPTISIGTPTAIYCTAGLNPVVLTTGASTTTSGMGPLAFPLPYLWEGPSPQGTTTGVSSYSCYVPGVYTLTIQDNANGCLKTGTINVLDRTQPPVITDPVANATLDCGSNSASLSIALTGTTTGGNRFLFKTYPSGASFTPTNAISVNINPILSGTSASLILVSDIGTYIYIVTNTLTGCTANGTFVVGAGGLDANFEPSPSSGYGSAAEPLNVTFNNLTTSIFGTSSITCVWSFGNGTSLTTTVNSNPSASYSAPGTYTVMLLASKGNCKDTAYKTVTVDIPSKLEVPNIFTPNGDGSNDVFFCKTSNLTEITALLFDRWGNKVYETTSASGNIAWDGKNPQGKECPSGVYFYIIKATGKDGTKYDTKGNVTLFR